MNRFQRSGPSWVPAFLFAAGGLFMGVQVFFEPFDSDSLVGLAGGLAGAGLIVFVFQLINYLRARALKQSFGDDAVVFDIIAYRELIPQLKLVSETLSLPAPLLRTGGTAGVVIDDDSLSLFRGVLTPVKVFSIPTMLIQGVAITRVQQDKWKLNTLEFSLHGHGDAALINFCVVRSGISLPGVVSRKTLVVLAANVGRYVGLPKDADLK